MQLFGLDPPSSRSRFSGSVSTPAYSLSASGGGDDGSLDFGTSLERTGATLPQQAFDARFPTEMADIDKLRGIMAPGLSAVRDARLRAIAKAKVLATLPAEAHAPIVYPVAIVKDYRTDETAQLLAFL